MKKIVTVLSALAIATSLSGCNIIIETAPEKPKTETATPAMPKGNVKIYIPSDNGSGLIARSLSIQYEDVNYVRILSEILAKDRASAHPIFPPMLSVRSVSVKDGIATVDFSKEILNLTSGTTTEELLISSMVDTLTEYPIITGVVFTAEGKSIKKLSGHYDMTQIFKRNEALIQK